MVECPACQSEKFKSLYSVKGDDLVRCKDCSLVYVPSPLPEVAAMYQASDQYGNERAEGFQEYANDPSAKIRSYEDELLHLEMTIGGKGRVLDVGCRQGLFGAVAKIRGWDTFVTDHSEPMVKRAHTDFGLPGFVTPADKVPLKEKKFDLLVMHDFIHRVSHPRSVLTELIRGLDPRGVLVLTTPNFSSFRARILGQRWSAFKNENSLLFFTPKNFRILIESVGLEIVSIHPLKSYFTLGEFLTGLQQYSKIVGSVLLSFAKFLKKDHHHIYWYTGEMRVVARNPEVKAKRKVFPVDQDPTPMLGVVCCPICRNELYPCGSEIHCTGCDAAFEIDEGVINFSKYAKRIKNKSS